MISGDCLKKRAVEPFRLSRSREFHSSSLAIMKKSIAFIVLISFCSLVQSHPLDKVGSGSDVSLKEIKDEVDRIRETKEIEIPPSLYQLIPVVKRN
jgi:hypothetical protein